MKKLLLISFAILFSFSFSYSQNFINGVIVYENQSGETRPLTGVTVYWLNTSLGTLSDTDGNYEDPFI